MSRQIALACAIVLGFAACAGAAEAPRGFRLDASAGGNVPLTWRSGDDLLAHAGWRADLAAEMDLESWIPARLEASGFAVSASGISSGGELYRGWFGLRLAALGGYRFPPLPERLGARLAILGGGAITAAGYDDTNLAFAYPSLVAMLRADVLASLDTFFWVGLPVELAFRESSYLSASVGLSVGWRVGPMAAREDR